MTLIPGRSDRFLVSMCGIGRTVTSTTVLSRITAALKADVDRCSASRVPHQPSTIAEATTSFETFSAVVPTCVNTYPLRRDAFTTCAEQPSCSASWKRLERDAPQPRTAADARTRELTEPLISTTSPPCRAITPSLAQPQNPTPPRSPSRQGSDRSYRFRPHPATLWTLPRHVGDVNP